MECSECLPQSVFNTQGSNMVKYLEQCNKGGTIQLDQYQVDAVLQLRRYFNKEPQVNPTNSDTAVVVLPTGCDGNGVVVMAPYVLNASRVLALTPSLVAAKQVNKSFSSFLLDRGVIKDKDKHKVLPSKSIVTNASQLTEALMTCVMIVNVSKTGGRFSIKIDDIPTDDNDLIIINEAHHFTESTWQLIANRFSTNRLLFLSTTAQYNGKLILKDILPCYELQHTEAVNRGIIRRVEFDKLIGGDDNYSYLSIAIRVEYHLNVHDSEEMTVAHQGIVLIHSTSAAEQFCDSYNRFYPGKCAVYISNAQQDVFERFVRGEIRTMVTKSDLLDDVNHSSVSVLGIASTISHSSRLVFSHSVVKVLQKSSPSDPVVAQVISHEHFHQVKTLNNFEQLAEVDPMEE